VTRLVYPEPAAGHGGVRGALHQFLAEPSTRLAATLFLSVDLHAQKYNPFFRLYFYQLLKVEALLLFQ